MKWVCQRSPPRDSRQAPAGRVVPYSFGIFHLPSHLPAAASPPFPLNRAYFTPPLPLLPLQKTQNADKQNLLLIRVSAGNAKTDQTIGLAGFYAVNLLFVPSIARKKISVNAKDTLNKKFVYSVRSWLSLYFL